MTTNDLRLPSARAIHATAVDLFRTLCSIYGQPDSWHGCWGLLTRAISDGLVTPNEHNRVCALLALTQDTTHRFSDLV